MSKLTNKCSAIWDDRPKWEDEDKRPGFKECKFTAETIVTDKSDVSHFTRHARIRIARRIIPYKPATAMMRNGRPNRKGSARPNHRQCNRLLAGTQEVSLT